MLLTRPLDSCLVARRRIVSSEADLAGSGSFGT